MRLKKLFWVKIFILSVIYVVTARFGLSLYPISGFATLIWLPSGICLSALLILGFELWPAVFIGAFFTNLLTGADPIASVGIATGNSLEAIVGTYILKKKFLFRNSLERLRDVIGLIIIAISMPLLISATLGVGSLLITGVIDESVAITTWLAWWVGDMVSILVVAPPILVWSSKSSFNFQIKKVPEIFALVSLFISTYLIVFGDLLKNLLSNKSFPYVIFPALIWASLRFGQSGGVIFTGILSGLTILSTIQGYGPFIHDSPSLNLLSLQIFMTVTSLTTLILAAATTEKEQTEKTKDEFVSIAAHEFKTPVTTIQAYTQLLFEYFKKNKDEKAKLYTSKISTQLDNINRLIINLFEVSRIQDGKLELDKKSFDFDFLVKETVEEMQHISNQHKITISGATGKYIYADRFRIAQVMTNLISNAIKFSPKRDRIKILLSSRKFSLKLEVQDFGIGISQRDSANVFKRFFQAKTNIRQSTAGLGLGLYISSEIIKNHQGKLAVKSEKGEGTIFSFTLPTSTRGLGLTKFYK